MTRQLVHYHPVVGATRELARRGNRKAAGAKAGQTVQEPDGGAERRNVRELVDAHVGLLAPDDGIDVGLSPALLLDGDDRVEADDVLLLADTEDFPYKRMLDELEEKYWGCLVSASLACADPLIKSSEPPYELRAAVACVYSSSPGRRSAAKET